MMDAIGAGFLLISFLELLLMFQEQHAVHEHLNFDISEFVQVYIICRMMIATQHKLTLNIRSYTGSVAR